METKLFHNLPCLVNGDDCIIFSPYAKKVAKIKASLVSSEKVKQHLNNNGFFGTPYDYPEQCNEFYQLIITITSDCNLRCKYCFADGGNKSFNISDDIMEKSIDYAIQNMKNSKKKGLVVSFFGGEPTLHINKIKFAIDYVKNKFPIGYECKFAITTNGVFSNDALNFLVKNNFFITLSMDGLPEIQDNLRPLANGEGSSKYVETTIKYLNKNRIDFLIRLTVTDKTVNQMPQIVKYLSELGAYTLHFETVSLAGRAINSEFNIDKPNADLFADKLIESIETAKNCNVTIINSAFMNILTPSLHFCDGKGENKLIVNYEGYFTTCLEVQDSCHPGIDNFVIGDYKDKISHKDLEKAPMIEKTIECKECFAKYICAGGCPMRNFHMKGDAYDIDEYRCIVMKKLLKYIITKMYNDSLDGKYNKEERGEICCE